MEPLITAEEVLGWIKTTYPNHDANDLFRRFLRDQHVDMFNYVAELIATDTLGEIKA